MSASRLGASRSPAVPTATIDSTSLRAASSAMASIACAVRWIASSPSRPVLSRSWPSRVTSARSTIGRHPPSAARSPMWNLTEFVPTSMTA